MCEDWQFEHIRDDPFEYPFDDETEEESEDDFDLDSGSPGPGSYDDWQDDWL